MCWASSSPSARSGPSPHRLPRRPCQAGYTQSVSATLNDLDQTPDRTVRVIVTVKPGTADEVAAVAKKAGANAVNPLFGTQSIVIEGKAAHVRAAVDTGQVLQIQRDTPSPTN